MEGVTVHDSLNQVSIESFDEQSLHSKDQASMTHDQWKVGLRKPAKMWQDNSMDKSLYLLESVKSSRAYNLASPQQKQQQSSLRSQRQNNRTALMTNQETTRAAPEPQLKEKKKFSVEGNQMHLKYTHARKSSVQPTRGK